ncbi:unnamed protein product [Ostreobium quekettii]|uniref:Protein kinase domain-containing protein n=1 Tax=Ostreobium quekettii TaxID=121088 RepID=A0A8S1IV11_9CHLO|nr:unnamed protein product [Ostreobium quekettii]
MEFLTLVGIFAGLVSTIKEHYNDMQSNKKKSERLKGRVDTLELIVKEMRNRYGKEAPERINRALAGVNAELNRVAALFKDIREQNRVQRMVEAPNISRKFQDIGMSLDYAVNVLDLAQNWHHSRKFEEFQGQALELMETVNVKADLILEKLTLRSDTGEQQLDNNEGELRYNQDMMEFLQDQLEKIDLVLSSKEYGQLLLRIERNEMSKEERAKWQESTRNLAHTRKLGYLLIRRHKQPFSLTTFYKVFEAREAVQMICGMLQTFVRDWCFPSVEIQNVVPPDRVRRDKSRLVGYLTYVLYGEVCAFKSDHQKEEWMGLKSRIQGWFDLLPMAVQHGDLELGECIDSMVYKGTRKGSPVAVKRLAKVDDPATLDLEDFAEFFTTIVALAKIRSKEHVVDIIGATETGMILMELGYTDLLRWLDSHHSEGLATKLGLLLQAAKGLQVVHEHRFVHRAVRTRKFVLFGDKACPTVKVAGFGLAIVRHEGEASETFRTYINKDRDTAWVAPEIFTGKAYTTASDIYSFGIVLYHVVGGLYPYGRSTPTAEVMKRVRNGELPSLPNGMELPERLSTLMQKCCSTEPTQRPVSMQEVYDDLKAVYDGLKNCP